MTASGMRPQQRDLRGTGSYQRASGFFAAICRPGAGQISDAADLHAAPDGASAVFTGLEVADLSAPARSFICRIDLATRQVARLTGGGDAVRGPKVSPDGRWVAFLSDRDGAGAQLFLFDLVGGGTRAAPQVDGWVEYLHWSSDGRRILLGVAAHGADVAAAYGAVTSRRAEGDAPSWTPRVDDGDGGDQGRRAWIYDMEQDRVHPVAAGGANVWEAVWCGDDRLAAVVSASPGEGQWYGSYLALARPDEDGWRAIYQPDDQLGWPAASPSGRRLAVVEAVCSDRCIVAGEVQLIDTASGRRRSVPTGGIDVTHCEWRSEDRLLIAGHRGLETAVGVYDAAADSFRGAWASEEIGSAGRFVSVSGMGEDGDCLFIAEGFRRAPEIAAIRSGAHRTVTSFDLGYGAEAAAIEEIETVRWRARDGLELEGILLRPQGSGPYPLVMNIHGGPVLHWRATWLGRPRLAPFAMLLQQSYAVFLPNPRGGTGRGREFARQVVGDMGGMDAQDLLAGLDHLVAAGIADPARLGVTGVSYGGFMTSWLITQDPRFAAAVAIAPISNFVTEQLTSNIPHFVSKFLRDEMSVPNSAYFTRSPLFQAHRVRTPTLNICGALDRCTPPEEAMQFHQALLTHGTRSVLAVYPQEGHGIHSFPASIDFAARLIDWFGDFMPSAPLSVTPI